MSKQPNCIQVGDFVKLNVGGSLFCTTVGTLKTAPDSFFNDIFNGLVEYKIDSEGNLFLLKYLNL